MQEIKDFLEPNEQVMEVIPRHWMNVAPILLTWALLEVMTLVGFYLLGRYGDNLRAGTGLAALGLGAIGVLGFVLGYISLWIWRQNSLVLTNKNLINVRQTSLFSRKVSQFSLERLQDVSAAQQGLLPSLFGYGEVTVETAGEEENFVFHWAPHPRALAARIMELHRMCVAQEPEKNPV